VHKCANAAFANLIGVHEHARAHICAVRVRKQEGVPSQPWSALQVAAQVPSQVKDHLTDGQLAPNRSDRHKLGWLNRSPSCCRPGCATTLHHGHCKTLASSSPQDHQRLWARTKNKEQYGCTRGLLHTLYAHNPAPEAARHVHLWCQHNVGCPRRGANARQVHAHTHFQSGGDAGHKQRQLLGHRRWRHANQLPQQPEHGHARLWVLLLQLLGTGAGHGWYAIVQQVRRAATAVKEGAPRFSVPRQSGRVAQCVVARTRIARLQGQDPALRMRAASRRTPVGAPTHKEHPILEGHHRNSYRCHNTPF